VLTFEPVAGRRRAKLFTLLNWRGRHPSGAAAGLIENFLGEGRGTWSEVAR
jgi:hypothetical protein